MFLYLQQSEFLPPSDMLDSVASKYCQEHSITQVLCYDFLFTVTGWVVYSSLSIILSYQVWPGTAEQGQSCHTAAAFSCRHLSQDYCSLCTDDSAGEVPGFWLGGAGEPWQVWSQDPTTGGTGQGHTTTSYICGSGISSGLSLSINNIHP